MNNAIEDKMKKSHNELLNMLKLFCEHILRQREQAANLSTHTSEPSRHFNSICHDDDDDDDDDEERTIPLQEIECKDSYDSNLDESTFLVTHLSDSNKDEYLTIGEDVELLLHRDPSTHILSIVSILEGFTDESPLEENDDLFDLESKENDWKKILYDAQIDDLMSEDKVFDPEIPENFFSLTYDCPDFEDSRARGFVHRPLELLSLACLYIWESDILDLIDLTFNLLA
uniref:Uncharacterized protein n=1 Tax=Tanacetum cinerariifolium TaxID=118510 RepID=A0A6L2NV08_TANCI|nr:hypothetical protein [Tanacetum cinerariifolium]